MDYIPGDLCDPQGLVKQCELRTSRTMVRTVTMITHRDLGDHGRVGPRVVMSADAALENYDCWVSPRTRPAGKPAGWVSPLFYIYTGIADH